MKKIIITVLSLMSLSSYASTGSGNYPDYYVATTVSYREGSFSLAAAKEIYSSYYLEGTFIDEGKQPYGIKNVNKVVNIDLVKMFVKDKFEQK